MNGRNSRGDTLVEVLIAMAIIGVSLAGAYSTASRGMQIAQQAQDRTKATKVIETYIDTLKSKAASSEAADTMFTYSAFCISNNDGSVAEQSISPFPDLFEAVLTSGSPDGVYLEDCVYDELYHAHVTRDGNRFTVNVRWERIGGGLDEIQAVYGVNESAGGGGPGGGPPGGGLPLIPPLPPPGGGDPLPPPPGGGGPGGGGGDPPPGGGRPVDPCRPIGGVSAC